MDLKTVFFVFIFFVLTVVLPTKSAEIPESNILSRLRRSEAEPKICSDPLPCQWGVYGNDSRKRIKFYIENTCICGEGSKCTMAEENLSLASYIFRCVSEVPATTAKPTSTSEKTETN